MADYGCYCDLSELKDRIAITDTPDDAKLLHLLQSVSRAIDSYCRRHFYVATQTRYYDGDAGTVYVTDQYTERTSEYLARLNVHDLLTVSSITMDSNGDATYEDSLDSDDYILYPYDAYPKTRIDMDLRRGSYGSWAKGQQAIQIVGTWGYGDGQNASPVLDSGCTGTAASTTATTVTLSDQSVLEIGQNVLLGTERMYVRTLTDATTDSGTVYRGINGSTAATQANVAVYVYQYPEEVREATLIGAAKLWKRKDSAFATMSGTPALGQIEVTRGLFKDPDITALLAPFVRRRVQAV